MSESLLIHQPEALLGWAAAGAAPVEFSPMAEVKQLVVSLDASTDENARDLGLWLTTLLCPVIGLGDAASALAPYCDAIVTDEAEAEALTQQVAANPVAATTLVELLRLTEAMPVNEALRVESLAYATLQAGAEYAGWLAGMARQPRPPAEQGPAVVLQREDTAVEMILNRPGNRNAMSVEMRDALNEALQTVLADPGIKSVRIAAAGKCFSTGGDLSEFGTVPDAATGHIVRGLSVPGALLARCAERVTAHVHGACIGSGVEFPAFAGHVTASSNAHFQLPEVGMGLIPGAGGCISIAQRIGRQRTAWLALSGKRIKAKQALEWGLVDEIIDE
ncbi:MAG: enoyl-CoA hydratase/isomerase family protein [Salinisphaeraceae bacterium]|nr:enoyl-CoA hydratase/isomerase family protein [Salinisphaeraceae bacterium]